MPDKYVRLASGDRLRVDRVGDQLWLWLLEAPISRDVERMIVLTRAEAEMLVTKVTALMGDVV